MNSSHIQTSLTSASEIKSEAESNPIKVLSTKIGTSWSYPLFCTLPNELIAYVPEKEDELIHLWDTAKDKLVGILREPSSVQCFMTPYVDGRLLTASSSCLRLWKTSTGESEVVSMLDKPINSIKVTAAGSIVCAYKNGSIEVKNPMTKTSYTLTGNYGTYPEIDITTQGQLIVCSMLSITQSTAGIETWDLETKKRIKDSKFSHNPWVKGGASLSISASEAKVAVSFSLMQGTGNYRIKILNATILEQLIEFDSGLRNILSLYWVPNTDLLLASGYQFSKIFDAATGLCLDTLKNEDFHGPVVPNHYLNLLRDSYGHASSKIIYSLKDKIFIVDHPVVKQELDKAKLKKQQEHTVLAAKISEATPMALDAVGVVAEYLTGISCAWLFSKNVCKEPEVYQTRKRKR